MRWTEIVIPTLKEDPHEAESISHRLLIRGGFIRKVSSGLYSFLPLGLMVLQRVIGIIREEMNRAGAQEVLLPSLQPGELWQKSGRWFEMGPELIRFKTRGDKDVVLGPTHEEVITVLAGGLINSYRDLPLNFYQIQTKFRDEARPRFGLIRAKEFIMKDAYSFDADEKGLEGTYNSMYETYVRIFKRLNIALEIVEAESGFIGGKFSQEFIAPSGSGEDVIVGCNTCQYRASYEKASGKIEEVSYREEKQLHLEEAHTPGITTINALENFLGIGTQKMIKTLIYKGGDKIISVLIRGDREVNETKLKAAVGREDISLAGVDVIEKVTGASIGFSGPVGLKGITMLADLSIQNIRNALAGANKKDWHLKNVNPGRDFEVEKFFDLSYPHEGDGCPKCSGKLSLKRGMELGHIFKLGTRYSEALQAKFLDENGKPCYAIMGCYGIGVTRAMASIVEQNHDEDGIIWPWEIAPFNVLILPIDMADSRIAERALELYTELKEKGLRVLMDDRTVRAGVKFKDADLIGIPIRINVGQKSIETGKLEMRFRREKKTIFLALEELFQYLEK